MFYFISDYARRMTSGPISRQIGGFWIRVGYFFTFGIFQTITKDTAIAGNIGNVGSENDKDLGVCSNGTFAKGTITAVTSPRVPSSLHAKAPASNIDRENSKKKYHTSQHAVYPYLAS